MFVLSPATVRDLPALQQIERSATDLYYEAGFSRAAILPRDDAGLRSLLGLTTTLLACDDDDPVGYVSFYPRGPYIHLEEIAVRRDFQRRGCGRALAGQALAAAADDPQCSHLSLVAFARAPWALALYRALGFLPPDELPAPPPRPDLLAELLAPRPAPGDEARLIMVRPAP